MIATMLCPDSKLRRASITAAVECRVYARKMIVGNLTEPPLRKEGTEDGLLPAEALD